MKKIIFIFICILLLVSGCGVVESDEAMIKINEVYPEAIFMSCPACGELVPWVNVFVRVLNNSDNKCDIMQINIEAPTKKIIDVKRPAQDSIESCNDDIVFKKNNEMQNNLSDCRDVLDRMKDGITCYGVKK